MTYTDALEATVSAKEAQREIEKHSLSFYDFMAYHGMQAEYEGAAVLAWLGY